MARVLVDNFDSYSDGDLNGQGSWSGDTTFDVQTSVKQAGAKAISAVSDGTRREIEKAITASANGSQIWYMRASTNAGSNGGVVFREASDPGGNSEIFFEFRSDGYISYYNGADFVQVAAYVADTWYKCETEWNATTGKARHRVNDGTWTAWYTTPYTFATIGYVYLLTRTNTGPTLYWDSLSEPYLIDNFVAGAGDGQVVYSGGADWDTAHNATAGTGHDLGAVADSCLSSNDYTVNRYFFPVNTSGLSTGAVISAATFWGKVQYIDDDTGTGYTNLVQTTQAATDDLVDADFDQCGSTHSPVTGATARNLSDMTVNVWCNWELNATGLGWISDSGFTKLGMRVKLDLTDSAPVNITQLGIYTSRSAGNEPYLRVYWNEAPTFTPVPGPFPLFFKE